MDREQYGLNSNSTSTIFTFTSNGTNGAVDKAIKYTPTINQNVYNLAFGDIVTISDDGEVVQIDDTAISGDRDLVLTTVASSIYEFTNDNPDKRVIFKGSNEARTRLYRRAITINYDEISKDFYIFGVRKRDDGILVQEDFDPNTNWHAYLIERKEDENNKEESGAQE
ncbi:hypothetical protein GCM10022386_05840 [Flavobacterium cheonhonense]|uniref:Uncharacterized protein n=1 Tax=Flavobacterium cheonhonense TaxID=706185 RepID=A0ABP7TFB2_9FLAO|nr:hypothetical protein [Flavobacterium cheonhonense]